METLQHPTVVCLMGPTASGKTQLAVELVQRLPFEIISVDSAMVYREMNIGTAKPTLEVLQLAPHHLLDIRDPSEPYSAADFRTDALHAIELILAKKKIPLLVGGTMLYFRALQKGLADMPSADAALRAQITAEALSLGWPALHQRLQQVDPQAAARIHAHDAQRIQRALEVFMLTGKNLTTWQQEHADELLNYHMINLAVAPSDRSILHARIAERFSQMLAQGLIEEVQKLYLRGDLDLNRPSMRSVGYRQVWEYLAGNISFIEMQEKGIAATRQLAKRQLTWLRSWPALKWFDSEEKHLLEHVLLYLNENSSRLSES